MELKTKPFCPEEQLRDDKDIEAFLNAARIGNDKKHLARSVKIADDAKRLNRFRKMGLLDYIQVFAILALYLWAIPTLISSGGVFACLIAVFLAIVTIGYLIKEVMK